MPNSAFTALLAESSPLTISVASSPSVAEQSSVRAVLSGNGGVGGHLEENERLALEGYRVNVARVLDHVVAGNGGARSFDNLGPNHAGLVTQEMLLRAEKVIKGFSQRLCTDVYDLGLLLAFLQREPEGRIEIVIEEANALTDPNSALFGRADFVSHPRVYVGIYKPKYPVEHVLVIDDHIARIETDRDERTASVSASNVDSEFVQDALALFTQVRRLSVRLSV